jgi:hypothetical protein
MEPIQSGVLLVPKRSPCFQQVTAIVKSCRCYSGLGLEPIRTVGVAWISVCSPDDFRAIIATMARQVVPNPMHRRRVARGLAHLLTSLAATDQ